MRGNVETPVRRAFTVVAGTARVRSTVSASWAPGPRFTRVVRLLVRGVPVGGKVEARCSGRGCPLKRRTFRARSGRATLTPSFLRARLRPGAVIEIRITVAGQTGKVVRYRVRKGKTPRATTLCLPPGATTPRAC